MITTYRKGTSLLTIFTVLAISLVYLQVNLFASPPGSEKLLTGTLMAHGTSFVTVNGNNALTGSTILPGTELTTSNKSAADVQLRGLGSFEMGPNSSLSVSFNTTGVEIILSSGYVVLTTDKDVNGSITTPDGKIVRTDPSRTSSVIGRVNNAANALPINAAQNGGGTDDADNDNKKDEGLLWWLTSNHARLFGIIVIAGATTGALIYVLHGPNKIGCGAQNPSVTLPCV